MDSFQRSQYSIFNKNKQPIEKPEGKPKPEIVKAPASPKITPELPPIEPPTTILQTNFTGDQSNRKKALIKPLLWLFGLVLLGIFFFSVGYYLQNRNNNQVKLPEIKIKDVGEILLEKFATKETLPAGTVLIKLWMDSNNDGKHDSWENNQYDIGANIRKKGEEAAFLWVETDGEGVIRLTGLDSKEKFEISYYVIDRGNTYNQDRHFYGQLNYEIFQSTDGSTGKIFGEWRDLKINDTGTEITLGLREYKPDKLFVTQASAAILYDAEGKQFASSSIFSNSTLPIQFEIRDNHIFYVKDGILYKNNPLVNMVYSQQFFNQINISDDSFWSISPNGSAIIYGDNNAAYFRNQDNACGKQQLYYENKPIALYTQSYPHDPVGVRFGDDHQAIIYGRVENNYHYYLVSCSNSQLTIKQLPIERQWYGGIFARHNRFVIKGPITHQNQTYGEGLYVYKLNEDKIERIGGDELNTTYFVANAYDGRYTILANTEEDQLKILNFDSATEIKILNFEIKPFFKQYDRHGLANGNFAYLGKDSFMFIDRFGQCSQNQACAEIKSFKIAGTTINVTDLVTIKDVYPMRVIGEISK